MAVEVIFFVVVAIQGLTFLDIDFAVVSANVSKVFSKDSMFVLALAHFFVVEVFVCVLLVRFEDVHALFEVFFGVVDVLERAVFPAVVFSFDEEEGFVGICKEKNKKL